MGQHDWDDDIQWSELLFLRVQFPSSFPFFIFSADREWVLYPGEPSVDATLRSNWKGLHKATAHSSEHWTFYPERYYGDATLKSTWNGIHKATAGSLEERHCK